MLILSRISYCVSRLNLGGFRFRENNDGRLNWRLKIRCDKDTQKKIFAGGGCATWRKFMRNSKKGVKLVLPLQTAAFAIETGRMCSFQSLPNQNSRGFSFGFTRGFEFFARYLTASTRFVRDQRRQTDGPIICRHPGFTRRRFLFRKNQSIGTTSTKKSTKSGFFVNNDWSTQV